MDLYPGSGLSVRRLNRQYGYIKPVRSRGWAALRMRGVGLTARAKQALKLRKKKAIRVELGKLVGKRDYESKKKQRQLLDEYKKFFKKKSTAKASGSNVAALKAKSKAREKKASPSKRKKRFPPVTLPGGQPLGSLIHSPGADPTTLETPVRGVDPTVHQPTPMDVEGMQGSKRSLVRTLDFRDVGRLVGRQTRSKVGWK